jgi:hypothetical protein
LIRSADIRFVTAAGWQAAFEAGVRTVIDLRNDDEIRPYPTPGPTVRAGTAQFAAPTAPPAVPAGIDQLWMPLDDIEDTELWRYLNDEHLNGTPLYYRPFLERKPERCVAVLVAVARARPGGVIFHCGAGRDRTGLVAMLLLALVAVPPHVIADDYELSAGQLGELFEVMGLQDQETAIETALALRGITARAAILATLEGLDVVRHLKAAGLSDEDLAAIRARI